MKLKNFITITTISIISIAFIYLFTMYRKIFTENTKFSEKELYIYIPQGSNYSDIKDTLQKYIANYENFEAMARQFGYDQEAPSGRFLLTKGMNSYQIYRAMKKDIPVRFTFNNQERIEDLANKFSQKLNVKASDILNTFTDTTFLKNSGFNKDNILCMCLPNTYEFYWNTHPLKIRNTLLQEYNRFWNIDRKEKAKKLGLSPTEVSILASIVQKETAKEDERPTVAGAYLNRLAKGMKLQADPTAVYAYKLKNNNFNQTIKRVYEKHLLINSPYNTYQYKGLPPGPITMPDIISIDAVLNAEKHNYIFFCASVEKFGYHAFAENIEQHEINRKKYIEWLNKKNIK